MRSPLAVLLPPSQGKAGGGGPPGWRPEDGRFGPALAVHRRRVAAALAEAGGGDKRLLGARGATLERARQANAALLGAPCLPAGRRYTGVVWDHLGLDSLSAPARRRALDAVVVLSALAGAVSPDDPLPDHRLGFGARLDPLGSLAAYWREPLSAALDEHLDGRLVIDLLPREHAAAWRPDPTRYDLRRVALVDAGGRAAGHGAKAAKGALARALVASADPERTLATWRHPSLQLAVTVPGPAERRRMGAR